MLMDDSAKITLNDAVQHLYHFCATLPADPYVDTRPIFTFSESVDNGAIKAITARVVLPNSVDSSVREACSQSRWKTQKYARRDAAFQAYVALFHAGLVSDHLLPIRGVDEAAAEAHTAVEKIVSLVDVSEQLDPWPKVGQAWQHAEDLHSSTITILHNGEILLEMVILMPQPLPRIANFELYWDHNVSFTAIISNSSCIPLYRDYIASAAQATSLLLSSVYKGRMDISQLDFIALFIAADARDLEAWLTSFRGRRPGESLMNTTTASSNVGIVRDLENYETPHIFQGVLAERMVVDDETASDANYLKVIRLSRRKDFLHELPSRDQETAVMPAFKHLPMTECEVDNLPFTYSQFALFVPSIMHQIAIWLVAEDLCKTLLSSVHFSNLSLVLTAISASAARERTNYQCMEFLVGFRRL